MNTRPVSFVSLFVFASAFHASALDWPQYRGPASDGRTSEKVVHPWTSAGPKQLWKIPSEGGFSSFAVSGGRAFTLSLKDAEGVRQESLVALDANTGKELWFAPLNFAKYDGGGDSGTSDNKGGDGPRSTPTTDGKSVYTMSSQLTLRAFDAATGKPSWTRDLLKEHVGRNIQWQNAASPLLAGGASLRGGRWSRRIAACDQSQGRIGSLESVR